MSHVIKAHPAFILFLILSIFSLSLHPPRAQAAMVTTGEYLHQEQITGERARLLETLQREQVRSVLLQLGVSPDVVEQRVQSMTLAELNELNARFDELPAGGASIVGITIFVLVLLIVLDLLGATDIFPAIRPIQIN